MQKGWLAGHGPETGEKKKGCRQSENGIRKEDPKEDTRSERDSCNTPFPLSVVPGLASIPSPHHSSHQWQSPSVCQRFIIVTNTPEKQLKRMGLFPLVVSECQSAWLALLLWAHERQSIVVERCGEAELFTRWQLEGEKVEERKEGKERGGRKGGRVRNET